MIETLISVVVPIVFGFVMFALGLTTRRDQFALALTRPRALVAGLVAQMLLLPIAAYAFVLLWGINGPYAFGVMILAACPGGVVTNMFTHIAGGRLALSITMTAVTTATAPLTVPLWATLWSRVFLDGATVEAGLLGVTLRMVSITLLPALAGLLLRERFPGVAARCGPLLLRSAMVLFWALILAGIAASLDAIRRHLFGLGLAMLVLAVALTALGLVLGALVRLPREDRVTLGIETGLQNGTVGLTFLGLLFGATGDDIPPAMVPLGLYGFVIFLVVVPMSYAARRYIGKT